MAIWVAPIIYRHFATTDVGGTYEHFATTDVGCTYEHLATIDVGFGGDECRICSESLTLHPPPQSLYLSAIQ